jgi:hypothetical protein
MSAALESSSAYATTAIAFDEKRSADPNPTNMSNPSISVKSPNADFHPVSLSPMNLFLYGSA